MLPSSDHLRTRLKVCSATVKAPDTSTKPSEAVEAALFAVALYHGRLSAAQCCRLARANPQYFARVNSLGAREREQLQTGELTLAAINGKHTNGHANGRNGHSNESLVDRLRRSSSNELATAVKAYGLNAFFDTAICPILNGTITE